jgi:hypothetical protein
MRGYLVQVTEVVASNPDDGPHSATLTVYDYDWDEIGYSDHWEATRPQSVGKDNRGPWQYTPALKIMLLNNKDNTPALKMEGWSAAPGKGDGKTGSHEVYGKYIGYGPITWEIIAVATGDTAAVSDNSALSEDASAYADSGADADAS